MKAFIYVKDLGSWSGSAIIARTCHATGVRGNNLQPTPQKGNQIPQSPAWGVSTGLPRGTKDAPDMYPYQVRCAACTRRPEQCSNIMPSKAMLVGLPASRNASIVSHSSHQSAWLMKTDRGSGTLHQSDQLVKVQTHPMIAVRRLDAGAFVKGEPRVMHAAADKHTRQWEERPLGPSSAMGERRCVRSGGCASGHPSGPPARRGNARTRSG